jgi:small basic protein (TIGR04137 family)
MAQLNQSARAVILPGSIANWEKVMTIDKSLKVKRGMARVRNVLNRAERLGKLQEAERWTEGDSVLGLPKVRVQKLALKKKKKAKKEEGEEGAEGAAAATPAEGAAAAKKPEAKKPEAKKEAPKK